VRLTRSVALLLCEDAWSWFAMNSEKGKEKWPGWETNGGILPEMPFECLCCTYGIRITGRKKKEEVEDRGIMKDERERCPLARLWPTGRCLDGNLPFVISADAAKREHERLEQKARLRKEREE